MNIYVSVNGDRFGVFSELTHVEVRLLINVLVPRFKKTLRLIM